MRIRTMRTAAALAVLSAGIGSAQASSYEMEFRFRNHLAAEVTASFEGSTRSIDVKTGYIQALTRLVSATRGVWSMTTYSIHVFDRKNPNKSYCRFSAEMEHQATSEWRCVPSTVSSHNGAKCQASLSNGKSHAYPCSFTFVME